MEANITKTSDIQITSDNIELVRQLSEQYNITELQEKCAEFTRSQHSFTAGEKNEINTQTSEVISDPPFDPQWTLWQFIDSSFPSGAFMHSGGLEAAFRAAMPRVPWTADTLTHYLRLYVQQTAGTLLPIVREAFVHGEDLHRYATLDRLTDQCTVGNHVTHRASTAMGLSLIITAVNCFPNNRLKEVKAFINSYEFAVNERVAQDALDRSQDVNPPPAPVARTIQGHYAPLFGLLCKRLALADDHVQIGQVFMYSSLRAVVSAAVRLNMIGPIEGQRIQASCYQLAQLLVRQHVDRPLALLGQTCPLLDLIQGSHDTLYSRLFNT